MQKLNPIYLLVLGILITTYCPVAFAAELNVGSGQTYATIASAISASSIGDTIIIYPGTYYENNLTPKSGIDDGHRSILMGAPGESRPVIDGNNAQIFNLTGINYVSLIELNITDGGSGGDGGYPIVIANETNSTYITIDHCKVYDTNVGGVTNANPAQIRIGRQAGGSHVVVSNCDIGGGVADGILLETTSFSYITLTNNYIHDAAYNIHFKWKADADQHVEVCYNLLAGTTADITVGFDQDYINFHDNVINATNKPMKFSDNWGGQHIQVVHNTVYGTGTIILFSSGSGYNTFEYNIFYPSSTVEDYGDIQSVFTDNYTSNPLWVDPNNGDFNLGVGSGAIGTARDGKDYGANISLVGIDHLTQGNKLLPPENFRVK